MPFSDAFNKAEIKKEDFKKNNLSNNKAKNLDKKEQNSSKTANKVEDCKTKLSQNDIKVNKLNRNFLKEGTLKLKLTAISPIHIGLGEVFEPTNYVIDENYLYTFNDDEFFEALTPVLQNQFLGIMQSDAGNNFVKIHEFVKNNKEIVKKIAFEKIKTSEGIQKDYNKKVGNGKFYKNVFNKFEIQKTQKKMLKMKSGAYKDIVYIPGSSLKGAISTAYQEFIFKTQGKQTWEEKFVNQKTIKEHIFKNFKVADSKIIKQPENQIAFACNKERFEEETNGLSTILEVIGQGSEFRVDINYNQFSNDKKIFDLNDILTSLNSHYLPIFKSIFDGKDEIRKYLKKDFIKQYENFTPKENQFLIRVGKHSGARAVSIEDIRAVGVKLCEISNKNDEKRLSKKTFLKEESTTWLFGENSTSTKDLLPFGWLLCEIID